MIEIFWSVHFYRGDRAINIQDHNCVVRMTDEQREWLGRALHARWDVEDERNEWRRSREWLEEIG